MRPPHRVSPPSNWRYRKVWEAVRNRALPELPLHFRSTIQIGGIHATEIYTFGAALSAAIEEEVVRTLNSLREVWDGERTFPNAQFVRQPQRFPDVLLIDEGQDQIIFGIELKSWYLLAKEGEPSFRFTATPSACAPADLLVIVPWTLSFAVAGAPIVFEPYIEVGALCGAIPKLLVASGTTDSRRHFYSLTRGRETVSRRQRAHRRYACV
jgi:hypothetical protein